MHNNCKKCRKIREIKESLNQKVPIELVNLIMLYAIKKKTICEYFS